MRQRLRDELLAPHAAAHHALEVALQDARERVAALQQRLLLTTQDAALQLQAQRDAAQHAEAQHRLLVAELQGAHQLAAQELGTPVKNVATRELHMSVIARALIL